MSLTEEGFSVMQVICRRGADDLDGEGLQQVVLKLLKFVTGGFPESIALAAVDLLGVLGSRCSGAGLLPLWCAALDALLDDPRVQVASAVAVCLFSQLRISGDRKLGPELISELLEDRLSRMGVAPVVLLREMAAALTENYAAFDCADFGEFWSHFFSALSGLLGDADDDVVVEGLNIYGILLACASYPTQLLVELSSSFLGLVRSFLASEDHEALVDAAAKAAAKGYPQAQGLLPADGVSEVCRVALQVAQECDGQETVPAAVSGWIDAAAALFPVEGSSAALGVLVELLVRVEVSSVRLYVAEKLADLVRHGRVDFSDPVLRGPEVMALSEAAVLIEVIVGMPTHRLLTAWYPEAAEVTGVDISPHVVRLWPALTAGERESMVAVDPLRVLFALWRHLCPGEPELAEVVFSSLVAQAANEGPDAAAVLEFLCNEPGPEAPLLSSTSPWAHLVASIGLFSRLATEGGTPAVREASRRLVRRANEALSEALAC